MPVTFAEDATGEEAKADVTRVTPDEKDGSARCETVKKVATDNLPILFCFGLMARLLALALLRFTALHKRGEVPLRSRIIGLCCCCCRRRNRDTPLARWASTPSFLTESLSTNNGASMDNEREPATPTTTEQPRPTNFDSVPSIPSDLF